MKHHLVFIRPVVGFSLLLGLVFFIIFLSLGGSVLAAACITDANCVGAIGTPVCSDQTCVAAGQWFKDIITRLLNIVVWPVFITVIIVMFIWAGILFLTAQGDPAKVSLATKAVLWAVIGTVVGLLGYVAVGVLRGVLNL